jgi:hypothetical protein
VTTVPGTDPDRASYQIAVQAAQATLTQAGNTAADSPGLAWIIGHAVLASLHPPRRRRPGQIPLSRRNKYPPGKPRTCQKVSRDCLASAQVFDISCSLVMI